MSFKSAYSAGWRAGMSPQPIIRHMDGTKTIGKPPCPYNKRLHFIQRALWHTGHHEGSIKRLRSYLENNC